MFFVYILFSLRDRKLYVGFTTNLEERMDEHQRGDVLSTKERRPLKLIYYEAYLKRNEAERRERYLKGGNGRQQLKIQLSETLKECGYKHLLT